MNENLKDNLICMFMIFYALIFKFKDFAHLCALMRLYAPLCVFAPLKFSKFVVLGYNYAQIDTNIH